MFYNNTASLSYSDSERRTKNNLDLLAQEIVSGSGISWAICKYAPHRRQITIPPPHYSVSTGQMPFVLHNQQHQSTVGRSLPENTKLISIIENVVHITAILNRHTWQHTHTQPFYGSVEFVPDNPGEPVPEETFTHSNSSWSSIIPKTWQIDKKLTRAQQLLWEHSKSQEFSKSNISPHPIIIKHSTSW